MHASSPSLSCVLDKRCIATVSLSALLHTCPGPAGITKRTYHSAQPKSPGLRKRQIVNAVTRSFTQPIPNIVGVHQASERNIGRFTSTQQYEKHKAKEVVIDHFYACNCSKEPEEAESFPFLAQVGQFFFSLAVATAFEASHMMPSLNGGGRHTEVAILLCSSWSKDRQPTWAWHTIRF